MNKRLLAASGLVLALVSTSGVPTVAQSEVGSGVSCATLQSLQPWHNLSEIDDLPHEYLESLSNGGAIYQVGSGSSFDGVPIARIGYNANNQAIAMQVYGCGSFYGWMAQ